MQNECYGFVTVLSFFGNFLIFHRAAFASNTGNWKLVIGNWNLLITNHQLQIIELDLTVTFVYPVAKYEIPST
jgi:hypothetical protein